MFLTGHVMFIRINIFLLIFSSFFLFLNFECLFVRQNYQVENRNVVDAFGRFRSVNVTPTEFQY